MEAAFRAGRFGEARALAERGQAAWRDRPGSDPYVRFRLLHAEVLLADGHVGEARGLISELKPESAEMRVWREVDLAKAMLKSGDLAGASRLLTGAVSSKAADGAAIEALILAGAIQNRNQAGGGAAMYREAIRKARVSGDAYREGLALNNLARIDWDRQRWDQAKGYYEAAEAALNRAGASYWGSSALSNLAVCYQRLGDLDRARKLQEQNLAVEEKARIGYGLVYAYHRMGLIYSQLGESGKALDLYFKAIAAGGRDKRANREEWQALNVELADAYIQRREWGLAEMFNREARWVGDSDEVRLNHAAILAGVGLGAEAERRYRDLSGAADPEIRWRGLLASARMQLRAGRVGESNEGFERAIDVVVRAAGRMGRQADAVTFLTQPIEIYREFVESLVTQGQPERALAVADSSRGLTLRGNSDAAAGFDSRRVRNAARARNSVLVSYWLAPKRGFAWVATAERIELVRLPAGAEQIKVWVREYRGEIERDGDPLKNRESAGWKLYGAVVGPIEGLIPEGASVIVSPDGALNELNLETLPCPDGRYWLEKATLSVAPSLRWLGDSAMGGFVPAAVLTVGDAVGREGYPKLPSARREIQGINARFEARRPRTLVGPKATVEGYKGSSPEQYGLIHFAAHAEPNMDSPQDSAVILSDGKLYAREIFETKPKLRADLVTVSACTSAGPKAYSGEGLIGFAWAFLNAGARNVIAGLWNVKDGATADLMDELYKRVAAGKSATAALHEAKLEFARTKGPVSRPINWGAFQVYRR